MHKHIPASLKHAIWIKYNGRRFDVKCYVKWCPNTLTPFTFEAGHNIPASKGGGTTLENLRPICSMCNKSMGNRYTIDEYSIQHQQHSKPRNIFTMCFKPNIKVTPDCKNPR